MLKGRKVKEVNLDQKANQVKEDYLDLQVWMVQMVNRVWMVHQDLLGKTENLDLLDHQDIKDHQDLLVYLELLDHPVFLERLGKKENQV